MNYWEKRFERLKRQQMRKAETVTAAMRREYTKALTALRKEVLDWYYRYAEENEIECYISLEERMACGIGACLACVCKTKEKDAHSNVNNKRICKDGPVFLSTEVDL